MSQDLYIIVGLGATGMSCARYLSKKKLPFAVVDSRENPPELAHFKEAYPNVSIALGNLDQPVLSQASHLIVSPGVSIKQPAIVKQIARGVTVEGDIELFAKEAKAPVIAITGTNAKSTVTTLVGQMANASGLYAEVGGNLGFPALDLLTTPAPQLFVLELSSFQLETTYSLAPKVATVLNVTPDHMDRYDSVQDYQATKLRIYDKCDVAVCNRDDPLTDCGTHYVTWKLQFTLQQPRANEFGLLQKNNEMYLAFEDKTLMLVRDLPILGRHYQANALASLAIGYGYGLAMDAMLETLRKFQGLPHRCQLVRTRGDVRWYNDSKGTNVGATQAAVEGLGSDIVGKIILIAGGLGKNADFSPLLPIIKKYVRSVILIGEAAPILADTFANSVDIHFAKTLEDAVIAADKIALPQDSVLLSPACASWDMFKNYEHRGDVFTEAVQGLK